MNKKKEVRLYSWLINRVSEIQSANRKIKKIKQLMPDKAKECLSFYKKEEDPDEIYCYWSLITDLYYEKILSFDSILEAAKMNKDELWKILSFRSIWDKCNNCNEVFLINVSSLADVENYENTTNHLCPFCDDVPSKHRKYFLNEESTTERLKYTPYRDYLQTKHWNFVRTKALKDADYKCSLCNSPKQLNVHHRTYEHKGEEYRYPKDLIVLCQSCHEKFHFPKKEVD